MAGRTNFNLFISYSNKDEELVNRLRDDLEKNEINVQLPKNLIRPENRLEETLRNLISEADGILALITQNSISSQYVMNEIGMARAFFDKGEKLLLPVIYGKVQIPFYIKDIQAIYWERDYNEVIESIKKAVYGFEEGRKKRPETNEMPKTKEIIQPAKEREPKFKSTQTVEIVTPEIIEEAIKQKGEEWINIYPNVTGFSVGNKITRGKDTGIPALLFIVTKKVRLPKSGMIPESITYIRRDDGKRYEILTDVIKILSDKPDENQFKKEDVDKNKGSQSEIFVSYDHINDLNFFNKIKESLFNYEVSTFDYGYDGFSVKVHSNELESKVKKTKVFISLYSNSYSQDVFLISQLDLATKFKKPILIVKSDENVIIKKKYSKNIIILFGKDDIGTELTQILKPTVIKDKEYESENEKRKSYIPFFLTEGNHHDTDDQLDFDNDIDSFASLIALKKVNPPLSIGLFGNWGSGKSFFMEKLLERIEEKAELDDPDFFQNIVPVKFNSWHYSDTNLWASLITQIFESLNDFTKRKKFGYEAIQAIYKDLTITSIQLEETQQKINVNDVQANVLKEQKGNIEKIIEQKKETLKIWKAKDFIRIVFSDPYIQKDFENIKEQFEEEKFIDNIDQIDSKLSEINTVREQIFESVKLLKNNRKGSSFRPL